jgi:hypothetical protein
MDRQLIGIGILVVCIVVAGAVMVPHSPTGAIGRHDPYTADAAIRAALDYIKSMPEFFVYNGNGLSVTSTAEGKCVGCWYVNVTFERNRADDQNQTERVTGIVFVNKNKVGRVELTQVNGSGSAQHTLVRSRGIVLYNDLEGGFYGILADDGSRYLPQNLPREYTEDKLRVNFTAALRPDIITTSNWGTPVEIKTIDTIK